MPCGRGGVHTIILLFRDDDILVAFTEYNRNVMRLDPPLIVTGERVDSFVKAFDSLLGRGITRIITNYAKHFMR